MKPKYFEYTLEGNAQQFDIEVLSLLRAAGAEGTQSQYALNSETLENLSIELYHRGVTGKEVLTADNTQPNYYVLNDEICSVIVSGLELGSYNISVSARYGTYKKVLCVIFFDVVAESGQGEPIEIELPVTSSISPDLSALARQETLLEVKADITPIATAAEAYNVGKTELAAAITAKGVETSPTETYPQMAGKVNAISQETYEINGGEMYAKQLFGSLTTPNYWNLYEVLAQLLSDGRLVNYGGILLAEYYKGYDSLALSGAGAGGAYVVSDKDGDGNFIMYTNDTTHVWDTEFDGKGNRWVAYCFADEYHDFQITDTNTSPRSIFIGRKVGTITSLVNGRTAQIVVPDGNKLKDISAGTYTQNYGADLIIKNIENHTNTSPLIYHAGNVEKIYLECDTISTDNAHQVIDADQNSMNNLRSIIIKGNSITGQIIDLGIIDGAYSSLSNVIIICPYVHASINSHGWVEKFNSLDSLCLFNVEDCDFYWRNHSSRGESNLKSVFLTYHINDKTKSVIVRGEVFGTPTLLDIQDGWCKPLTITSFTTLTKQNVQDHIFDRLGVNDISTGTVTITLASAVLALFTQEEIDAVVERTNISIVGA